MLVFPIPFASYTSLYIIISTFGNLRIKYIDMLITNHYQSYILDKERKDAKGQKKNKYPIIWMPIISTLENKSYYRICIDLYL